MTNEELAILPNRDVVELLAEKGWAISKRAKTVMRTLFDVTRGIVEQSPKRTRKVVNILKTS